MDRVMKNGRGAAEPAETAAARGLTEQRERFAQAYVANKCSSATRAAIEAGYSPRTARSQASRLLTNVKVRARIDELLAPVYARLEAGSDSALRELALIAFSNISRIVRWGPDGVQLRDLEEISEDDWRAVAEVTDTVNRGRRTIRVRMKDKVAALDKLAKFLGLYNDRPKVKSPLEDELANLTDEAVDARIEALRVANLRADRGPAEK